MTADAAQTKSVGVLGTILAFLVPGLTLAVVWVMMSMFAMLGANGVMKRVDDLTTGYVVGTVSLMLVCTLVSGFASRALARTGRMPLWGAIMLTTALSVVTECVGGCLIFVFLLSALGIV